MSKAKSTIQVRFEQAESESFSIMVDEDFHADASSFPPGEPVYLRALTPFPISSRSASQGSVKIDASGKTFQHTEQITFIGENSALVSYEASRLIGYKWIGKGLGDVQLSGRHVKAGSSGWAVLSITYEVVYQRLLLENAAEAGGVIVHAQDSEGRQGYVTVQFSGEASDAEPVYASIRNYCTRAPVAGASVYLDGNFIGVTDSYGRIFLGNLVRGSQHAIKVTAPGFQDSDTDALANDSFRVE